MSNSCTTPRTISPPGSSVHGIPQARILEWNAISSSRGIFLTQGWNPSLTHWQVDSFPLSHEEALIAHINFLNYLCTVACWLAVCVTSMWDQWEWASLLVSVLGHGWVPCVESGQAQVGAIFSFFHPLAFLLMLLHSLSSFFFQYKCVSTSGGPTPWSPFSSPSLLWGCG